MSIITKLKFQTVALILSSYCVFGIFNKLYADPEIPVLGETASINLKREVEFGSGLFQKLQEKGYVIDNPLVSRYLQDVGESLLSSLDVRTRDYHFYLVKDSSINAFAAPGGYIGVNLGLIQAADTEDELASVIAHEIAHVELMHSMQMMDKASTVNVASLISVVAAILMSAKDPEAAGAIIYTGIAGSTQAMINFTRENEYEADRLGVDILTKSDYDPEAMVDFMKLLQSREQGGELASIEYLRTHPVNSNRIAEIKARISALPEKKPKYTRYQQFRNYLLYLYPQIAGSTSQSRFSLALEHTRNGRYLRAEKIYRELLQTDPDSIWYNYALAENMEYRKKLDSAAAIYRSMLLLYPEDLALTSRLVAVLLRQNQPQQALQTVKKISEQHRLQPAMYKLLVKIYRRLNNEPYRQLAEANYHWFSGNKKQAVILFKALLDESVLDPANEEIIRERLETESKEK